MTRSEKLQEVIRLAKNGVEYTPQSDKTRELNAFALELFLAEQKRSEGCETCLHEKEFVIDGLHMYFLRGNKIYEIGREAPNDNPCGTVKCCPDCGRDLTEGESV